MSALQNAVCKTEPPQKRFLLPGYHFDEHLTVRVPNYSAGINNMHICTDLTLSPSFVTILCIYKFSFISHQIYIPKSNSLLLCTNLVNKADEDCYWFLSGFIILHHSLRISSLQSYSSSLRFEDTHCYAAFLRSNNSISIRVRSVYWLRY